MIIDETKKVKVNEISLEEPKKEELTKKNDKKTKDKKENEAYEPKYKFTLSNFDGPLDLLVSLVKEKNINILDIDIAELANQYLEIIKHLQDNDFDIASEYLVMAATLLQLKARMVLQDPEVEEEIKQEKKRLLEQIAEYEKFKEISITLREHETEDVTEFVRETDDSILDGHANSSRLVVTLRKMFERTYAEMIRNIKITTIAISPEEQKKRIIELFRHKNELNFKEVFHVPTMGHFVITLLAVLDLARQQIVVMQQHGDTDITFTKGVEYE